MAKEILQTPAFLEFYHSVDKRTQEKIDFILHMMEELSQVNAKFVKKLTGTEFYEMRISTGNEYRIILFPIDDASLSKATKILLLNGFLKKSTKDYKAQTALANRLISFYYETED
jgi:mRNA-degrading endonuclease RelE of RelBE toxin-antitoxin system